MCSGWLGRAGRGIGAAVPLFVALWVLASFVQALRPTLEPGLIPGPKPPSHDYAYGAKALLGGSYVVDWKGEAYVPRYGPGFPVLLMPAVALGGVEAAVIVPYLAAVVLAALTALVAAKLRGPLAAPLAVYLVLAPTGTRAYSQVVMSELPAATLAMLEVALLGLGRGRLATVAAGLVGGLLVVTRVETLVLVLAGLAGATAGGEWRRRVAWYLLGAAPMLVFLGVWQAHLYGSPWTTGYQTLGKQPSHGFFHWSYALNRPDNFEPGVLRNWRPGLGDQPNLAFYARQLLGEDNYATVTVAGVVRRLVDGRLTARLPDGDATPLGAGAVGLLGLARLALVRGGAGAVGRFGLVAVASLVALYALYYYQTPRFMLLSAALVNLGAAALLAEGLTLAGRAAAWPLVVLGRRRARRSLPAT